MTPKVDRNKVTSGGASYIRTSVSKRVCQARPRIKQIPIPFTVAACDIQTSIFCIKMNERSMRGVRMSECLGFRLF